MLSFWFGHLCLNFSVKCSPVTRLSQNKTVSYNFAKGEYSRLRTILGEIDWCKEVESMNVCESWNFLLQRLQSAIDL